ncbi:HPF/RaiA family ribosome-associated protein [Candidatus Pacearchaeota archaeon]|nr:HPF/RaiA family ribosome-associated protein [Candidatus Pacearchaeota archaeon]
MKLPLQITFRHMEHSDAVEAKIRERVEELEQFYDQIMHCRVVVEEDHKHHHQGNLFSVHIDLTVPGKELVVSRGPDGNHAHEDMYVALRDAFDAMRRQLENFARVQRRKVKSHEAPPHGKISKLFPSEDYGRIASADGRDIYFHRNSIIDADFDALDIGMEVRFAEENGEQGPQASTVYLIGKHHIVE